MNVWTAYRTGMRTKTGGTGSVGEVIKQLCRNLHHPKKLSWTLSPIDFIRYREFDFALRAISKLATSRDVLDLSSPKLLPLTLAWRLAGAQRVVSTDILQREIDWVSTKGQVLGLSRLQCQVEDARRLSFGSESFDLVTSISVFEHIAPERDGDLPAIREVARVLRPGGCAVITVPFSRKYFADYQTSDVYERTADSGPIFFQRFYTEQLLRRNFVELGGLELRHLSFIEERYGSESPRRRINHLINCSPTQNLIFGPFFPLLSHVFLSPPKPLHKCRKPYIACMVLRKPAISAMAHAA